MRAIPLRDGPEITRLPLDGDYGDGYNGAASVALKHGGRVFVIWSRGAGWDHVSVSRRDRLPTWDEMMEIKRLWFDPEEVCVMFAPAESQYVNNHAYCLHWWRPCHDDGTAIPFPMPDPILVGMPGKDATLPLKRRR
jgi:hypothetical protein